MLKAEFTYPDAISYVDRRIRTEGYFEATSWLEEIAESMDECRPKDMLEDDIDEDVRGVPPLYGFHKIDSV